MFQVKIEQPLLLPPILEKKIYYRLKSPGYYLLAFISQDGDHVIEAPTNGRRALDIACVCHLDLTRGVVGTTHVELERAFYYMAHKARLFDEDVKTGWIEAKIY